MDDTRVYVSNQNGGEESDNIEAFLVAVISGSMESAYAARFGHFGPSGVIGTTDPAPQAPTELEDLEPEDEAPSAGDAWA